MDDLDHRNLGTRLDLWHIREDAPGTAFWHPRSNTLHRILEDYIRRKMRRLGYAEVRTLQPKTKNGLVLWHRNVWPRWIVISI